MFKYLFYFIIGLLLLILVLSDIAWWIINYSDARSFEANRDLYLSRFPEFLQNARLVTGIEIGLLVLSFISLRRLREAPSLRNIARVLSIISVVTIFWLVFTLM